MPNDSNHAFLVSIARNADPSYQVLLSGIADWWALCGSLSPKQLAAVNVSAKLQGRTLPPGLLDPEPHEPLEDILAGKAPANDSVWADLCSEIGNAFTRAAERLR